jgi:threonine/homoserine efflux transporter RhtA
VTVTIEVLGPLALSIIAGRRRSSWLWAGVALIGVVALAGGGWDRLDLLGVLCRLGAAASWAIYILASARVGAAFPRLDGLAIAMTIGAVLSLPFGIVQAGAALLRPEIARARRRSPAVVDAAVRVRADRAAAPTGSGVRHSDVARPGSRGVGRLGTARTASRVAGDPWESSW